MITTKLHLCSAHSCPTVFRLSLDSFHDASEGRKLIESIYSKNNNYLSMDKSYEDDKTLFLTQDRGFCTIISPEKNRKSHWLYNNFINNEILSNDILLD